MALMTEHGMDNFDSQSLMHEASSMISYMIHYRMEQATLCEQELMKRLYWLCFAGQWYVFDSGKYCRGQFLH